MSYVESRIVSRRAIGFVAVAIFHVALIYALANGLAQTVVNVVKGPIEASIIETPDTPDDVPPPPPPPALDVPPPPFVPPPEVTINLPQAAAPATAITQVQTKAPVSNVVPPQSDPRHKNRQPEYPPSSRRAGEEGVVLLLLYVNERGRVQEARVETSSGFPKLDKAAVREAELSWRFLPAKENGRAVAAWHKFSVRFRLTD